MPAGSELPGVLILAQHFHLKDGVGHGINPDTRVKDLTLEEEAKIRDYIDQANIIVEGDLRRNVALDIKRLVEIQSFRGTRHRKNLPCRGQRTKTNARTCKGPKRTVANKKK